MTDKGHEVWEFEGERHFQVGRTPSPAGGPETVKIEPFRFDQMRRGCYDPDARVHDMDLGGIWASLNFPSHDHRLLRPRVLAAAGPRARLAVTQAWNDWMFEEWWGAHPERFIPIGITDLADAERGAAEIRRNATRGFTTVSLPERPHRIGLPVALRRSLGTDHPRLRGDRDGRSASTSVRRAWPTTPRGAPAIQLGATLFGQLSLTACAEWLWSGWAVKFPDLKIAMSEGGIGWVAMLIDRLDNIVDRSGYGLSGFGRRDPPTCCAGTSGSARSTTRRRSTPATRIGVENIMVEVDYPHGDSTWPDTQL